MAETMANDDEGRVAARRALAAAISQHTAYSFRAATTQINALHKEIDGLSRVLAMELGDLLDGMSPAELQAFASGRYTTSRAKALRAAIDAWALTLNEAVTTSWATGVPKFALHEAAFAATLAGKAAESIAGVAKADGIYKVAMRQPVLGKLVDDMLKDVADATKGRVYATVRGGIAAGQANADIIRALRGTQALQYTDGIMQVTKNEAERVVRTARNHVSNVAYDETWQAIGVAEVMDLATLDGRTSKFCASIDGRRHRVGEPHPKPPYHPFCRTVQIPVLEDGPVGNRPYVRSLKVTGRDGDRSFRAIGDMTRNQREKVGLKVGQVKADTKFGKWFGNQDAAFQKEWLGPKRYRLYKEGGYSLDRFADPRGGEYTLDQLRQRDAQTFKALFGD